MQIHPREQSQALQSHFKLHSLPFILRSKYAVTIVTNKPAKAMNRVAN
jgi:hypothetical protein